MNTIRTIIIGLILTFNYATAQDTLYIFKGATPVYKRLVSATDSVTFKKNYPVFGSFTYDGYTYKTVKIGTQTWMAENLQSIHYRNGDAIPNVTNNTEWTNLHSAAWCDYNNDAAYGIKYGHLYSYNAVADTRNLAPPGWHIPSDAEWTILGDYVTTHVATSISPAKALAGTYDWASSSINGAVGRVLTLNNSTGFNALPSGYRIGVNGTFFWGGVGGKSAQWWTSSLEHNLNGTILPVHRTIYSDSNTFSSSNDNGQGYAVRCVKD